MVSGTPTVWSTPIAVGLLLLLAGGAGLGEPVQAQPSVELTTHTSADSVLVGGRFVVSFVAEHDGTARVLFPDPVRGPETFGDIEIRRRRTVERRSVGGGRQLDSAAYEVTTFALDTARVPPVPLRVVVGSDTTIASTPPRGVKVVSVLKENRRGIYSVAPLASFPAPVWPWVLAALAAALLAGGGYYLWHRRAQPEEPSTGVPGSLAQVDQTPYEAATARIRQLESYDLSDPDAIKPFYVELSNAVRVYVANELGVGALKRTTQEIVERLSARSDVPEAAVEHVQSVLEQADHVKFAGRRPSPEAHDRALNAARAALDAIETTPRGAEAEIDEVAAAS